MTLSISWDGSIAASPGDVGTDSCARAIKFLSDYKREQALQLHCLQEEARALYEAAGPNEDLGIIPEVRVASPPVLDAGSLVLFIQVAGEAVPGRLYPDLSWWCPGLDEINLAATQHCALDYAIQHHEVIAALGFDAGELRKQLADLHLAP